MAYPEDDVGAEPAGDYYPMPSFSSKLSYHLEGLIPLILILIIAFFLAVRFDIISTNTPGVGIVADLFGGQKPAKLLIIGQTSSEVLSILDKEKELVDYFVLSARELERNPRERLANYDIVMLDQSQEADKSVSRVLGEAIERYVKTGGSFIVVMDSGIYRTGIDGRLAFDVVGWKATFGDIVPVTCDRIREGQLTCEQKLAVRGKVLSQLENHPIVQGIPEAPAGVGRSYLLETFDVAPNGKEIAFIRDDRTNSTFTGIVEKPLVVGKSIYFNYNPGFTEGILTNAIKYAR